MKLVDEWPRAWRWWSIQLNALGNMLLVALLSFPDLAQQLWLALPPQVMDLLPERIAYWVPVLILIASGGARLVQQEKKDGE